METLKFCTKCCMDGTAKEITFDSDGVCNFCHEAQKQLAEVAEEKLNYDSRIFDIRLEGMGNKYDVLIGLSGGVDSATALVEVVNQGLKPLCYSIDNGYNDPKADENIMNLVERLKVPFFRYNIDLNKFKELQSAFMKAGVPNLEIPTDHILMASAYELAAQYGIKTIISGGNVNTESIMPPSWGYNARDLTHIKDIYKWATGKKLTGLPLCGIWKWNWYRWYKGIKTFYILDYLDYNREKSEKYLENMFNYQSTGEKHEESLFTRWFQNFYLYTKFGIDKRKAHYASMINSGQMTRADAMFRLTASPVYPFLGIEKKVLKYPKREHKEFKMDKWYGRISKLVKLFK